MDMIMNLDVEIENAISFYEPSLLKLKYSDIEKMYEMYPNLKEYEIYYKNIFRYKKYMLKKNEEQLITKLSKAYNDSEKIFSALSDSDIRFGNIKDENDNEVELTNTNYRRYIESTNRRVRKDAFEALYKTYKQHKTTYTYLLTDHVKKNATFAKIRGYKSVLDKETYKDELNTKVVDTLIKSVSKGLKPLHKYYKLRKEMLNLDELHLYDTYTPVVSDVAKSYTYEDAQKIIKDVTSIYGEEYSKVIDRAFKERWIDVYPGKGKTSGAFSGGCYDTYPYILTNFQGKYDDVSTLIHELGHSVHSYYSREYNPYMYSDYRIVVAEVASTVNELLLAKYILKNSKSNKEKLYILDRLINLYKGTIYRQTMFEEFEKYVYEKIEKDEPLSSDELESYYYDLNKKYFGNDVVIDDEIRYEWERIPHFYYNFYVYKYATGLSSASKIVSDITNGKENATTNYIKFLKSGSTMPPNEELKIAGVDLTKEETYKNAIKMFEELVNEFEKTYKEFKRSGE
jgi:oligoendopeptidase F